MRFTLLNLSMMKTQFCLLSLGPLTKVQALALFLVLKVLYSILSEEESIRQVIPEVEFDDPAVFVTDSTGASIDVEPIDMTFFASSVGED